MGVTEKHKGIAIGMEDFKEIISIELHFLFLRKMLLFKTS